MIDKKLPIYFAIFIAVYGSEIGSNVNNLGSKLYRTTSWRYENFVFSPFSIHSALSFLYQGASDKTAVSLRRILNVPVERNATARAYKIVTDAVLRSSFVDILIANKIYLREDYRLRNDFKFIAEYFFRAEAENVDFKRKESTAALINAWVSRRTRNRITQLIQADDLDPWTTRAVLLDAIYFKGNWSTPFNDYFTREKIFHVSAVETLKCQMMYNEEYFDYGEILALGSKVLRLKYKDERFSMVIVLPEPEINLDELEKRLLHIDVSTLVLHRRKVAVFLPKFKIETVSYLNEPLKQIGLANVFSGTANFSNMLVSDKTFAIGKVIQKAFVEVNEEGTEAAAAAGLEVVQLSLGPSVPLFKANRPFMFYITVEEADGECINCNIVLFMGKVVHPQF
ncbi:hypothetical protein Trydic_g14199 [Trypoxylus dichotomus]